MAQKQVSNRKRLIVIGGSSGALEGLLVMLPLLEKGFSIPIVIVLHRSSSTDNGLIDLLGTKTSMPVKEADEKEMLQPGIYLAPPDYHLLLEDDGRLSLDASEKVHYSRPSIEVSFSSAAAAYKENLVAVLLSGANADGAMAMVTVKSYGGKNIVQDPSDALVAYMPAQALQLAPIDYVLPAAHIAVLLNKIAKE